MNDKPIWSILVATLGQRWERFHRLVNILTPQLEQVDGAVELIAYWNVGERPLAEIRQTLMDSASGTYSSFIDDDDTVPYYFIAEVLGAIESGYRTNGDEYVDYVGWQMQTYVDGAPLKPTFHSLKYDRWSDDLVGYYRDVSHLNPVLRRRLVESGADFTRTQPPEDVAWSDQLRGHLKTESYVDRVMYHYHSSTTDSTWQPGGGKPHVGVTVPPPISLPSAHMRYITTEARFSE